MVCEAFRGAAQIQTESSRPLEAVSGGGLRKTGGLLFPSARDSVRNETFFFCVKPCTKIMITSHPLNVQDTFRQTLVVADVR